MDLLQFAKQIDERVLMLLHPKNEAIGKVQVV